MADTTRDEQRIQAARAKLDDYWKANIRIITILLLIWFAVAYVPPLFINGFNQIVIAGFPFGYYMGSQGSLIVFVVEIFFYAWYMNRLDEQYGLVGLKR
jgi:putative solute:sodium symporter small subunit